MGGKRQQVAGKHVIITGGSSGIGFALAKQAVQLGANVTLIARTKSKLEEAVARLRQMDGSSQIGSSRVGFQAADVTKWEQVEAAVAASEATFGPVHMLICNAGVSVPGYFHDQDVQVFADTMSLNYLGTVHAIKAVYNGMLTRNSGHISIVSSTAGTLGIIGYTSYSPTKYALRGLADSLRNELQGTGVSVSVAFPPDTDTPGFQQENNSKPLETKLISEDGSTVYSADKVASLMFRGILQGSYILPNPDLILSIHTLIVQGLSPRSFPRVLWEMFLGWLGPIIHWIYLATVDGFSRKHATARYSKFWGAGAGGAGTLSSMPTSGKGSVSKAGSTAATPTMSGGLLQEQHT